MQRLLAKRQEQVLQEQSRESVQRNQRFIDHWLGIDLERLMAENGPKYTCDACPLLKELRGADSHGNPFLGVTVSSCDFRGKRIGADQVLGDLAEEAYEVHNPDERLGYAERLEQVILKLKNDGLLVKDTYEDYVQSQRGNPFASLTGEPLLSEEAYAKKLHWREQNIRDAVHWLRTCARHRIRMSPSY